jgi:hypothetical protein
MVVSIIGAVLIPCYGVGRTRCDRRDPQPCRPPTDRQPKESGGMALAGIIVGWVAFAVALAVLAYRGRHRVRVNNANTTNYTGDGAGRAGHPCGG